MTPDRTRWCELLVGLERVDVLDVVRVLDRLFVTIESTDRRKGCGACGTRASVKDRDRVELADLPAFGSPVTLVWLKRRWRCGDADCGAGTWTEDRPDIAPARATMTQRAGVWASVCDIEAHTVIDLIEGRQAPDLDRWLVEQSGEWRSKVRVTVSDLHEPYRAALGRHLPDATAVADPFHVVGVATRCVDATRRRVQNEVLGHRGRKADPLYRSRKLLAMAEERLDDDATSRSSTRGRCSTRPPASLLATAPAVCSSPRRSLPDSPTGTTCGSARPATSAALWPASPTTFTSR